MTDMGNNANKEDFAMENQNNEPLLSVRNLQISFASEAGTVHAVRNMNFDFVSRQNNWYCWRIWIW